MRPIGLHFAIQEISAQPRLNAERGEEIGSNLRGESVLRLPVSGQRESIAAVSREGLNALRRTFPIEIIRVGSLCPVRAVVALSPRLAKVEQCAGIAIRQRTQQRRVHHGKNRGVGADAQGQSEDDHQREAGVVPERSDAIA